MIVSYRKIENKINEHVLCINIAPFNATNNILQNRSKFISVYHTDYIEKRVTTPPINRSIHRNPPINCDLPQSEPASATSANIAL